MTRGGLCHRRTSLFFFFYTKDGPVLNTHKEFQHLIFEGYVKTLSSLEYLRWRAVAYCVDGFQILAANLIIEFCEIN